MGKVIELEDRMSMDDRIDSMLRRVTREDGSVDAACEAEHARLVARLERRWREAWPDDESSG